MDSPGETTLTALADPRLEIEDLLVAVRPRVERELRRHRLPPPDAEDILQQTFLALVYQWHRVRNPEAWLLGTVRNQCRLYWRRRRDRIYRAVDLAVLEGLATPQTPSQARRDLWSDVEASLSRLSERCQRLLRLRYQLGMDCAEIAERTGYSPHSISKLTRRSLESLAKEIAAAAQGKGEPSVD